MTHIEILGDETQTKESCNKSVITPSKVVGGSNNNNNHSTHHHHSHKQGKGMEKSKIPSPLPGHKGKKHSHPHPVGLKTFRLHWNGGTNPHSSSPNQSQSSRAQVISMKLERLHDWAHFLEEVNNNSSLSFPASVQQIFTLDGQSLSSLNDLENQSELVVSGHEDFHVSSPFSGEKQPRGSGGKSPLRPASASKVRRFVRANFTKSVIIESTPLDGDEHEMMGIGMGLEDNNPLMKTFSEQNVSFRAHVSNSLNSSPLPNSYDHKVYAKPRPVSCVGVRTEGMEHVGGSDGERRSLKNGLSPHAPGSVSKIPKRINHGSGVGVAESLMTTSTPAVLHSPTPAKVTPKRTLVRVTNKTGPIRTTPTNKPESTRDYIRPRLVTLVVKGVKPRRTAGFLLNKKTAVSFDQVLTSMTESLRPPWGAIRKVYTLKGLELTKLEEFFETEKVFVVCPNDKNNPGDLELNQEEASLLKLPWLPDALGGRGRGIEVTKFKKKQFFDDKRSKVFVMRRHMGQWDEHPRQITDRYWVGRNVGDGNFAVVRELEDKESEAAYALKIICKSRCTRDTPPEHEFTILSKLAHPNIIQVYETIHTEKVLYVIMEMVAGGDLFDALTKVTKFPEEESASMTRDVASALSYLHSRNIVHRDIKPENLLVSYGRVGHIRIKVGDFGLAEEIKGPLYTVCGTPTYVAPEILAETGYGKPVDVWALGVILYVLLCGYPPFVSPDGVQEVLFDMILSAEFEFHPDAWDAISVDAKNLISLMLEMDPDLRLEADEVLNHPWLATSADDETKKRKMLARRDEFRFCIYDELGLNKVPPPSPPPPPVPLALAPSSI